MKNSGQYIILLGASVGCISMLYWLGLLLHLPLAIICLIIIAAIFFLFRWQRDNVVQETEPHNKWAWLILLAGIGIIAQKTQPAALKHGDWDAWAIWNFHAKYLSDPAHWHNLLRNTENAHAEYPLCLPATLAFLHRMAGGHFSLALPFAFSCFIMLCIPVLIYTETLKKNIVIAVFALYFCTQDLFFIEKGVSQYADTLLGFLFLCALICINYARDGNRKMLTLTTFFLGCCVWTKNEGIILVAIFVAFYAPLLFARKNILSSMAGVLLPLIAWTTFKVGNPVENDMLAKQSGNIRRLITDKARYKTIYESFKLNLNGKFHYLKIGVYIYMIICVIQKQFPHRQILLLFTCLLAYMTIYLVTPYDLDWHLLTSQDRLMHQLMPATMYVLADKFTEIKFSLPGKAAKE